MERFGMDHGLVVLTLWGSSGEESDIFILVGELSGSFFTNNVGRNDFTDGGIDMLFYTV